MEHSWVCLPSLVWAEAELTKAQRQKRTITMTAKSARRLDDAVLFQHGVECHGDEDGPVARHKQLAPQGKTMKNKMSTGVLQLTELRHQRR